MLFFTFFPVLCNRGSQRSFKRTSPSLYSMGGGGSNNNSFYMSKDSSKGTGLGTGQKRDTRLLSCVIKDMGTSANSAQQSYHRSPNTSPSYDHKNFISCSDPYHNMISQRQVRSESFYKQNDNQYDKQNCTTLIEIETDSDSNRINPLLTLHGSPSFKKALIVKMLSPNLPVIVP